MLILVTDGVALILQQFKLSLRAANKTSPKDGKIIIPLLDPSRLVKERRKEKT